MYDLDNLKVRLLDLNYITFIRLYEDEEDLYTVQEFINYNEDPKNLQQAEKYIKDLQSENFIKININPIIHKETKDLIFNSLGFHMIRREFDELKQVHIKKSKLPMLFLRDYFEYNELELPDELKLNILDYDNVKPVISFENALNLNIKEINTYYNEGEI
jgi:hypothetical protein